MVTKTAIITIIIALLSVNVMDCLKSSEICYRKLYCNGKGNTDCSTTDCIGLNAYECYRYECSRNAEACEEYQAIRNELDSRKNVKLDKAFTIGLMQGISFSSKRLKKYEYILKKVEVCSD